KPQKSKVPTMPKVSLINYNTTKLSADLEQEKVIVIGAAAGGGEAISEILTTLPKDMPPIAIVGTFPRNMTNSFIQRMNNYSKLLLKICEGNEYMIPGTVYFAPEDTHIMVNRYGKRLTIECGKGRKINGVRPSIDILFNSASEITKENAIGILLTGNGVDGVKGLCNIKDKGGRTLCQDIDSCVAKDKVKMAKSLNASNKFVKLSDMSKVLQDMVSKD
ncbi:MAG: chemotaxis protein CheB, partial [Firmicutes bacterium]|nr:chemotaxis protein CheB [Bacillota bacterium]